MASILQNQSPILRFYSSKNIVGFACYETTCKAFFGPIGVSDNCRGLKIGKALLISALQGLKEMGYAYAIIGGPEDAVGFYEKTVNAIIIPGSVPGIYKDII
ncbi:MAG: GNAT family N-acetyltransferase [Clostridiaceae bacterium]|nr:GNAT family N-acetyltransferase [Clostridiaceae bacterium]